MREYTIKTVYYSGYRYNNIKIFNILNLSDVLTILKFLKTFYAENIFSISRTGKVQSAEIVNEAPFNPSAVALRYIFPGVVLGLTIARHLPWKASFPGC